MESVASDTAGDRGAPFMEFTVTTTVLPVPDGEFRSLRCMTLDSQHDQSKLNKCLTLDLEVMCKECHNERDGDYSGDSIEEKLTKSTRSVIKRHPELGLDPEAITVRFAPKAEEKCVRASECDDRVHFEIHVPSYKSQAMSGSPPLSQIAIAAWVQTNKSYDELCGCLDVQPEYRFGGLFVSESPPIRAERPEGGRKVIEYERSLHESSED